MPDGSVTFAQAAVMWALGALSMLAISFAINWLCPPEDGFSEGDWE